MRIREGAPRAKRRYIAVAVAAALGLAPHAPAFADWNAGAGDWNDAANWSSAAVPIATDTTTIANGGTATLTGSGASEKLFVEGGSTLEILGGGNLATREPVQIGNVSTGTVIVSGLGSNWSSVTGSLGVQVGAGGTVQILNGGAMNADTVRLAGELRIEGSGSTFSGGVLIGIGGRLVMNGGTFLGGISAAAPGSVQIAGGATVTLSSGLSSTRSTFTVDGAGSTLTATVVFVQMVGSGALTVSNAGKMNMAGSTVALLTGATLNIGAGGAPGTINAPSIVGGSSSAAVSGIVNFNHSDAGYFFTTDGTSSGAAIPIMNNIVVNQIGTGTTVLTAANTYFGPTTVSAGTLVVNGSIVSDTTVNSGGTLGGSGTVGNVTVASGGALAPGNSIGTLTVNGNVNFAAGSIYRVEANAAGASDRTNASGTANLSGGTVAVQAASGTYQRNTTYTILNAAGGVTGTFSGVTSNFAFLTPGLAYDTNNVFLTLAQTSAFDSVALTPNQAAVSSLLSTIQAGGGGSADLQAALNTLSGLTAEQARAAYDSLGGAASASAAFKAQFSMADGFMRALTNRLGGAGSGGLTAMLPVKVASTSSNLDLSPATAREGAWVLGYGNDGKTNSDANAAGYRQDGAGIAFGADTTLNREWRIGGAVNAGTQRADLNAGAGNVKTDGVSLAGYARYSAGPIVVDSIVGLGQNRNQSTRAVDVGGISRTANADYHSDQQFAYVEASYRAWQLEPVAALGYVRVKNPSYTETGAGGLSLAVDGQSRESIKSYLGVRSTYELGLSLKLTARALWSHEFGDADSALSSARFTGAPGVGAFQTNGVALKRDGALFGLGLSGELQKNLSLFGDLAMETRQNQWNATLFAGARYAF